MENELPQSNPIHPDHPTDFTPIYNEPILSADSGDIQLPILNLSGMLPTAITIPTATPRKFSEQFVVYGSTSTVYGLYYYDTKNQGWKTDAKKLGNWGSVVTESDLNVAHLAATDVFIMAKVYGILTGIGPPVIRFLTDSSNPPTTVRAGYRNQAYNNNSNDEVSFMCVAKKGDYYMFDTNGIIASFSLAYYVIPLS